MESTFLYFLVCVLALTAGAPSSDDVEDYEIEVPKECNGTQFCSVPPKNYEKIQKMINALLPDDLKTNVEQRLDEDDTESPTSDKHNCPYKKSKFYPHWVLTTDNKMKLVAQTDIFQQLITVTQCAYNKVSSNKKNQCFQDLAVENYGMKSTCEEHFVTHNVLIVDTKSRKLQLEAIEKSVSCFCKVSDDF